MNSSRIVIVQSVVALVLVLSVVACIAIHPHAVVYLVRALTAIARILTAIAQIIRAIGRNCANSNSSPTGPARRSGPRRA